MRELILTPAGDFSPEPVSWLWDDRLPAGGLALAAGREGTGKSSFGIWLAAGVSTGQVPGCYAGQPKTVLYYATEDSWGMTLAPRLEAAGADMGKIFALSVEGRGLQFPDDVPRLTDIVAQKGVGLIVLDPIISVLGDANQNSNPAVRRALEPLISMASREKCSILGLTHFGKGKVKDASSLITGSGAFKDLARSIFGFARTRDSTGAPIWVMTQTKNSLGLTSQKSLRYEICAVENPTGGTVARLEWRGDAKISVPEILAGKSLDAENTEILLWLRDALEDGPRLASEIFSAGTKIGYSKNALKAARLKIGAISRKISFEEGWEWFLQNSDEDILEAL